MLRWDKLLEMARGEWGEDKVENSRLKKKYERGEAAPEDLIELAKLYLESKRPKKCEEVLASLLSVRDVPEDILKEACALLERIGSYERAFEGYRMMSELNISSALPIYRMGKIFEMQGRLGEAIEMHKRAIEIEPDNPECYYRLGVAYTKNHQYEEAEEQYRKAIAIDPTHYKSYTNLGYILDLRGKRNAALQQFRKAVQYNPKSAEVHFNLGALYGEEGQNELAIKEFRIGLEIDPSSIEGRYNLGLALMNEGFLDDAADDAIVRNHPLPDPHAVLPAAVDEYRIPPTGAVETDDPRRQQTAIAQALMRPEPSQSPNGLLADVERLIEAGQFGLLGAQLQFQLLYLLMWIGSDGPFAHGRRHGKTDKRTGVLGRCEQRPKDPTQPLTEPFRQQRHQKRYGHQDREGKLTYRPASPPCHRSCPSLPRQQGALTYAHPGRSMPSMPSPRPRVPGRREKPPYSPSSPDSMVSFQSSMFSR